MAIRAVSVKMRLPAIVIGGPPHSGKSVLSVSLTSALYARGVSHYLLRAAPDGEGNWSNDVSDAVRAKIRFKGDWTPHWIDVTRRDIANRPLPLLVDVGGILSPENFDVFAACTGMIVLSRDHEIARQWESAAAEHELPLLGSIHSDLHGTSAIADDGEVLRGAQAGLHRGQTATGPVFDALVDRLEAALRVDTDQIEHAQLQNAPKTCALVRCDQLAYQIYGPSGQFVYADRQRFVATHLPTGEPIALFGKMPSWLAVEAGRARDIDAVFTAREGWIRPPRIQQDDNMSLNDAHTLNILKLTIVQPEPRKAIVKLIRPGDSYLNHADLDGACVPALPRDTDVLIDGSLPLWLFAALGRAYASCRSVTGNQPVGEFDVLPEFRSL
jgi:CRISPR-associated protein Csx3